MKRPSLIPKIENLKRDQRQKRLLGLDLGLSDHFLFSGKCRTFTYLGLTEVLSFCGVTMKNWLQMTQILQICTVQQQKKF